MMRPVPESALVTVVLETPQTLAKTFIFLFVNMYAAKMYSRNPHGIYSCVLVYAFIVSYILCFVKQKGSFPDQTD